MKYIVFLRLDAPLKNRDGVIGGYLT